MGEVDFRAWAHGSQLKRPGRDGMARNAATVLGNVGSRRHLPVLREAAAAHPSDTVRATAEWAVRRIEGRAGST
jgi:epoxyqueuosine reductase